MADYLIGLDFGTSQTKVCLLNKNSGIREFIKFDNSNYFLPSLIVKKLDNTFCYGNENESGIKYRYFKMAAAEDDELIQITNEDLDGNLGENMTIDDFRKYSTDFEIKPEILVVLYFTYSYLFIKQQKSTPKNQSPFGSLLGRLVGNNTTTQNTFSINLGIPTEWNNPNHIKRKIKFQSLLISSIKLANKFDNLNDFLNAKDTDLLDKISEINKIHLSDLDGKEENEKAKLIKVWLKEYNLSVFPESAAGVNYLLSTKRLANGYYATLDIGAGTSDIAMFKVTDHCLETYFCSESVEIASNDFYREYARQLYENEVVTFEEIKNAENIIINNEVINDDFYNNARNNVRGLNNTGIEFAVRRTFSRKYYSILYPVNPIMAANTKNYMNNCPIIVFGGGANLEGFYNGNYCFYQGNNPYGNHDRNFSAIPITNYVNQVDIDDENAKILEYINLLILALGLTYGEQNDDYIPFVIPHEPYFPVEPPTGRYFYYDLQDAAYK